MEQGRKAGSTQGLALALGLENPDRPDIDVVESLFLNTVIYENESLGAYMKTLTGGAEEAKAIDSGQAGQTGKTCEQESEDS